MRVYRHKQILNCSGLASPGMEELQQEVLRSDTVLVVTHEDPTIGQDVEVTSYLCDDEITFLQVSLLEENIGYLLGFLCKHEYDLAPISSFREYDALIHYLAKRRRFEPKTPVPTEKKSRWGRTPS